MVVLVGNTLCVQEVRSIVHTGKQFACTRKTYFACDTRRVVHTIGITCSEWIIHTIMLVCSTCLCAHLYCVTSTIISCVR
jgi:hypothetical protein